MHVMVVGGAGYIGSHAVKQLIEAGHQVVVVDNLYRGHVQAVHPEAAFYEADLLDTEKLAGILSDHEVECVMHFAALAYVGESVSEPLAYYWNNTAGTISLLGAMRQAGVRRLVFSSTAATYGEVKHQLSVLAKIGSQTLDQTHNFGESGLAIWWTIAQKPLLGGMAHFE